MKRNYLIAISTYKEEQNIFRLIKRIREQFKDISILIINDKSEDNTKNLIKKLNDKNLIYLERPKKLGLGTAHKLSIFYAIKYKFKFLITMDADFSHDPSYLKNLMSLSDENNFVIGSRFCENGKSDYKGFRKLVSFCGNYLAKNLLDLEINEITTYYRIYSIKLLEKIPYDELNAEGYSFGVRLIWLMKKMDAKLLETPIHFRDRSFGKSKIPKFQIVYSLIDLILIKLKDIFMKQKFYQINNNTFNFKNQCSKCNQNFMSLVNKKKFVCLVCKNSYFEK